MNQNDPLQRTTGRITKATPYTYVLFSLVLIQVWDTSSFA